MRRRRILLALCALAVGGVLWAFLGRDAGAPGGDAAPLGEDARQPTREETVPTLATRASAGGRATKAEPDAAGAATGVPPKELAARPTMRIRGQVRRAQRALPDGAIV